MFRAFSPSELFPPASTAERSPNATTGNGAGIAQDAADTGCPACGGRFPPSIRDDEMVRPARTGGRHRPGRPRASRLSIRSVRRRTMFIAAFSSPASNRTTVSYRPSVHQIPLYTIRPFVSVSMSFQFCSKTSRDRDFLNLASAKNSIVIPRTMMGNGTVREYLWQPLCTGRAPAGPAPGPLYSRLIFDIPDAPISPIPTIPINAATPDSMISKNRRAAAPIAIHNPTINRILFMCGAPQHPFSAFNHLKAPDSASIPWLRRPGFSRDNVQIQAPFPPARAEAIPIRKVRGIARPAPGGSPGPAGFATPAADTEYRPTPV